MKVFKLFIFVVVIGLITGLSYGCGQQKTRPILKKPVVKDYGKLVGLVEVYGKNVYIVYNYTSRSRVDYCVEGKLKNDVARFEGKVIEVEGETERMGWSGTIKVKKIVKVIGKAKEGYRIYKKIQPKK